MNIARLLLSYVSAVDDIILTGYGLRVWFSFIGLMFVAKPYSTFCHGVCHKFETKQQ